VIVVACAIAGTGVFTRALAETVTALPTLTQLAVMAGTATACALMIAMPVANLHRGELVHVHLDEAALAAGLLLLPAPHAILAHAAGAIAGRLVLDRRLHGVEHRNLKRLHSQAVLLIDAAVMAWMLHTFGHGAPRAVVLVGAAIVGSVIAGSIVSLTASSAERQRPWPRLRPSLLRHATGGLVAGALGATAGLLGTTDIRLTVLAVPALVMALVASRAAIKMSAARDHVDQFLDGLIDVLGAGDTTQAEARLATARWLVLDGGRTTSAYAVPHEQLLAALDAAGAASLDNLRLRDELALQARKDPLTGVGNRRHLDDFLSEVTEANRPYAVVVADMDGLKPINDSFGHEAGDTLLTTIAARLAAAVRATDVVTRVGGDEFVLILEGADTDVAQCLMEDVDGEICAPVEIGHLHVAPSLSWGAASYPADGDRPRPCSRRPTPACTRPSAPGRRRPRRRRLLTVRGRGHWPGRAVASDLGSSRGTGTATLERRPWLADPKAPVPASSPGAVLDLQRLAGNRATAQRLAVQKQPEAETKPASNPQEAEAAGLTPSISWIDDLPAHLKTQIDTFSQDYFDKQPPAKQQALVDKRSANRSTFVVNMRPYLGSDTAVAAHFKEIAPVGSIKGQGDQLWTHSSTRERLLEVKADVEAKGSPMPSTTVGQSLRGRHLHPESKAPGAGMMTHAMGFAIDWKAYATPHVTDKRLHALFETVTDRKPALDIGVGWTQRHDLIEAMGKDKDGVSAAGQKLLDKIEKDFDDLVAASNRFKVDLPETSLAPLRAVESARSAVASAQRDLAQLYKSKKKTKQQIEDAKARIVTARAELDAAVVAARPLLPAIFKPWTDKLDARIAKIEATASAKGVDLAQLTGKHGFAELGKKLAGAKRGQRPHLAVAKAVLREVRQVVGAVNEVAHRVAAAEAWLAAPGKRPPDPADAERWSGDLRELRAQLDAVREAARPLQSTLSALVPGAKVDVKERKPGAAARITDGTIAALRKKLDKLPARVEASATKLDKVRKPLAELVASEQSVAAEIASRKEYSAAATKRLGGAAVQGLLADKLQLISLRGAKDGLLTDAGGFVFGAKSVKNPAITQLLGMMGGTEGGGFVTRDRDGGEQQRKQAKARAWSSEYGFNTTFVLAMVRRGFELGVAWEQSPDTMHFELVEGRRLLESGGTREMTAGKAAG